MNLRGRMALALGIAAGTLLTGSAWLAWAATTGNFGTPPRVIPYRGHLDQNGAPVTGTAVMVFNLYDVDQGANAALWTESHDGTSGHAPVVALVGGQFSVALGTHTPLVDSLFLRPELYLGVAVSRDASPPVELGGRQRILSVPSAITAAQAFDFNVTGTLTANGANAVIQGITLSRGFANSSSATAAEISNDGVGFKELMLLGNRANADGRRHVGIYDDAKVYGNLAITGTHFNVRPTAAYILKAFNTPYTADADGWVVARISYQADGDRGYIDGKIDQGFGLATVTSASVHQFGGSDANVPVNGISYPVRRGDAWRVTFASTSGTCTGAVYWVPLGQ